MCLDCTNNCQTCMNSTYCFSCVDGYSITTESTCVESTRTVTGCKQLIQGTAKCALCHEEYFRDNEGGCGKCLGNCKTCFEPGTCIQCQNEFFLTRDSTECISYDELENCTEKTHSGCTMCDDGYYIDGQYCSLCSDRIANCSLCTNDGVCQMCEDENVLVNNECVHFSMIRKCTKSSGSKCTECSFWYKPNESKTMCDTAPVWWVILLIVLFGIAVIVAVIAIVIIVAKRIIKYRREEKKRKEFCIFDMKKSNVEFHPTDNPEVVINTKQIHFIVDSVDYISEEMQIPVEEETRALICVGNRSKNTLKIQFSVKEGCYKYEIRTRPQMITIPKGKAIEFEVFIRPLCTCVIEDIIKMFSLNMKKGITTETNINIKAETVLSTRLDPEELIEDKKLGEGSFGIVYLGEFRGNKVAIKKMKQSDNSKAQMEEMIKEMEMLDKFRSEYIIHFFGAVIIRGKECMVTEFAQYGSIQDLVEKRPDSNGVDHRMKVKFMVDCSRGIQYLHRNGILHRDIKPDNFLVISLDSNDRVNAKLTDFGSSRNVNMMMTNMTFTKGIGTPKYMAPEVLGKEKYKMPADIYAFAITMYQILCWEEVFPKSRFKFPWHIADFIIKGNRPEQRSSMTDDEYGSICECWCQNPKERKTIDEVVSRLDELFSK